MWTTIQTNFQKCPLWNHSCPTVKHGPRGILSMVIVMLESKEHIFYVKPSMASMKMERICVCIYIWKWSVCVYITFYENGWPISFIEKQPMFSTLVQSGTALDFAQEACARPEPGWHGWGQAWGFSPRKGDVLTNNHGIIYLYIYIQIAMSQNPGPQTLPWKCQVNGSSFSQIR